MCLGADSAGAACAAPPGSSQLCREDISLQDGCRTAEMKTCLDFFLSSRAVCPVVQRCKNREDSYILSSKNILLWKKKTGRATYTCLFKEWS